jgi:hypothetical protein
MTNKVWMWIFFYHLAVVKFQALYPESESSHPL